MNGITDIHNHILFGVDDGADSLDISLEMLKCEFQQGVNKVILTPHYDKSVYKAEPEIVRAHYEQLKKKVKEILPEMELYLGNEIMLCNDMALKLDKGRIFPLADSRYALIEFYPSVQYSLMEKSLKELLNGGYIPIVAHCERYKCLRSAFNGIHAKNISHLVEMGAYMQANVTSVLGRDSKFVIKMIDNDYLHFMASDAHGLEKRGVHWDKCIKFLNKKYNRNYLEQLLVKNPEKVLKNEYI